MLKNMKKGMTLVELIVTLSIMLVIMTPVYTAFYLGYSQYVIQNDTVISQKKARDTIVIINEELRKYQDKNTTIKDSGKTLYINSSLIYTFSSLEKKLLKNGVSIFEDGENVDVLGFSAEEIVQDTYDAGVIKVSLSLKVGKGNEVKVQNTFRRKL